MLNQGAEAAEVVAVAGDVINRGCVRDDAAEANHAPARVQLPQCFGQELIGL